VQIQVGYCGILDQNLRRVVENDIEEGGSRQSASKILRVDPANENGQFGISANAIAALNRF
jgi:hypothetical protein